MQKRTQRVHQEEDRTTKGRGQGQSLMINKEGGLSSGSEVTIYKRAVAMSVGGRFRDSDVYDHKYGVRYTVLAWI